VTDSNVGAHVMVSPLLLRYKASFQLGRRPTCRFSVTMMA
jgi:hypothetical protein